MGKWDFLRPYDAQVQSELAAGDVTQAFEALLRGYQHVVVQYCIALLGNTADGEDVAQEVFLAIRRALPGYEPRALLRTWVFQIVRKRCSTYRQRIWGRMTRLRTHRSAITRTVVPDPPRSPEAEHVALTEDLRTQDQLHRLERCLRRLPKRDRGLVMLYYYEDLTFRAMAQQLLMSEAAVRRAVHAVEKRLQECMTQEEAV
jgi:RNA polymerase sigma-70 factor, ECF subfamily